MLKPIYLRKFENEVVKAKKRGKNIEKLKEVMKLLTKKSHFHQSIITTSLRASILVIGNVTLSLTGYWYIKRQKRRLSLLE